jgi:hypothetical protein
MPTVSDSVVKSKAIELGNAGKSSTELSNWLTANGATADQSFSAGVEYNKALANRTASAASRRTSSGSTTSSNVTGNIADGLNGVLDVFKSNSAYGNIDKNKEEYNISSVLENISKNGLSVNALMGQGKDLLQQISNQLAIESQLRTDINEKTGLAGDLSKDVREQMVQSTSLAIRFGYGIEDITGAYQNLVEESGRFNVINQTTLEGALGVSRAFIGDFKEVGKVYNEFEKVGFGARSAIEAIDKAGRESQGIGLRGKTTVKDIRENIEKLNQYGFQKGIDGLAQMSRKATEFRMSMGEAFKVADSVMDPDKAIELSANLQVLGGAIGAFNDPLKLMYMATNNVEGLQDALIEAAGSLANYNSEQGRFEITGVNLRRAKEMAAQLGVDYKELTKSAIASQERLAASSDLMAKGFDMNEKDKEFLINMSRMDGGRMVIDVPKSLQESLGIKDTRVALTDLTDTQAQALKKYGEDMSNMSSEEVARDQFESITNIQRDVNSMVNMARIRITGGIRDKGGLDVDRITAGLKEQVTRYTNEVQSGTNGPVLEGMKREIEGMISIVKATNIGAAGLDMIKSLETKLNTVSGANNPNNTTAPTTPLQSKAITFKHELSISQNITDAASQALMQNKDVWSDVFKRQEKDYLSL